MGHDPEDGPFDRRYRQDHSPWNAHSQGPKNWADRVVFVPQLFAAAVGIAGLSAIAVLPALLQIAAGLTFKWPDKPDLYLISPWIGTILAGSMGIVWFPYWITTRGYGGGLRGREADDEQPQEDKHDTAPSTPTGHEPEIDQAERVAPVKSRGSIMSGTATMLERRKLKRLFIVTVTGLIPAIIILVLKDPVKVMSTSGIIAATQTPFIVLPALLVNLLRRPSSRILSTSQ